MWKDIPIHELQAMVWLDSHEKKHDLKVDNKYIWRKDLCIDHSEQAKT